MSTVGFSQRAVAAMIWGVSAVNLDLRQQATMRDTAGSANQMICWSPLPDSKSQSLTPNTNVIQVTPYFDAKEIRPMVLEIPTADGVIDGTLMEMFFRTYANYIRVEKDQTRIGKS